VSLLHRNIASNISGAAIVTVLTVIITPLQIRILGMEAFGLIGFIATLQVAFTSLDFGLSSTVTRELAADRSPNAADSTALLRTSITIYWIVGFSTAIIMILLARPIALHWLNVTQLDSQTTIVGLQMIAVYLGLRWPVALYSGILSGLQNMVLLNIVKICTTVLRLGGGIAAILIWRDFRAFLLWNLISAVIETIAFSQACRRSHAAFPKGFGISLETIRSIWRFSISMNLLSILAVIIVQLDRVVVSKLLPMSMLGAYNLAYTLASGIALIIGAISAANLPALAAAHNHTTRTAFTARFIEAETTLLFIVGIPTFVLIGYGNVIVTAWVGAAAAALATLPLQLLAVGFWCSAILSCSYTAAVATGAPGRFLKVNLILILPYAATLYFLTQHYGLIGSAISWIVLNVVYLLTLVRFTHSQLLSLSLRKWLTGGVVPTTLAGLFSFVAIPYAFAEVVGDNVGILIALPISAGVYVGLLVIWAVWHLQGGEGTSPWARTRLLIHRQVLRSANTDI
jgi:O-antigen/teichoic acid export membrane protein